MEICFATNNKGKLDEVRSLAGSGFKILSLQDIGCNEELPETMPDLEGNSLQKARYVYDRYHVNCMADDTGLEVEALKGAPGVYSARYAGLQCSPEDNMYLLLEKLKAEGNRKARFRTCITLLIQNKAHQFEGAVEGVILKEKRGEKGFGYDPVFQAEGFSKSFAEMSMEEKNEISHRARALRKMIRFLHTGQKS